MKNKLKNISLIALITTLLFSCHDIEVPVTTQLTPDIFPKNSSQFAQAAGPPYAALRGNYSLDYYFLQSYTTDEAVLPARGGNWYDNRGYIDMHYHTWTKDHGATNSTWNWLSLIIGTSNQAISILDQNIPASTTTKAQSLAEIKMVRALAYFMMMDMYGNVPIYSEYGDFTQKTNSPRAEVFKFIEAEVLAAIPALSDQTGITTYGRATKWMAYTLLAKMYLNAEIYTGTAKLKECIDACDKVISSGKFAIEPRASYLKMFYPDNGPAMKEFIFAIPYDPTFGSMPGTNGNMYHARYDVPRSLRAKYALPFTPSAPSSTWPEFYAYFKDKNDIRNDQWLTGLQFMNDGVTPITVKTTKKGYDQFYTGSDGSATYTYQVELTPEIKLRQDVATFDLGNDEIAWNMGYRNVKFYPDATSLNRNQNNDKPFFRYSDVVLMKAEAALRSGSKDTAVELVNQLRKNRTTADALTDITLDGLYEERSREFAWESWHRNDMIRFGKFENKWGFKTDANLNKRIFPIPQGALTLNPALKQNPGY
jgi:starch-binding outer membrane protein, SusD/RagB family